MKILKTLTCATALILTAGHTSTATAHALIGELVNNGQVKVYDMTCPASHPVGGVNVKDFFSGNSFVTATISKGNVARKYTDPTGGDATPSAHGGAARVAQGAGVYRIVVSASDDNGNAYALNYHCYPNATSTNEPLSIPLITRQ